MWASGSELQVIDRFMFYCAGVSEGRGNEHAGGDLPACGRASQSGPTAQGISEACKISNIYLLTPQY
jgi:hypothetical protein